MTCCPNESPTSLKTERIRAQIYKTRDLTRADVFDYIEGFYNKFPATVTWAASALKHLNVPQLEAKIFMALRAKSSAPSLGSSAVSIDKSGRPMAFDHHTNQFLSY